jgi:ribosome biogenesis SPOUT family RNA methylase Rps3
MFGRKRRFYALELSTSKMNYVTVRHLVEEAFSADLLNLWKDYVFAYF